MRHNAHSSLLDLTELFQGRLRHSYSKHRSAAACLSILVATICVGAQSACGAGSSQLTTTLSAINSGSVNPGDSPTYVIKIVNKGPGVATGVAVRVGLPAEFTYKATTEIGGNGQVRTQPYDAAARSRDPEWGLWSLPAPATSASGSAVYGELSITFSVDAGGAPGNYKMTAHPSSDSTELIADAKPLDVTIAAAPHLSMQISATPGTIRPGSNVTYVVTVTNDGSGPATAVNVLVTLPAAFAWTDTVGISGNSSRSNAVDPLKLTSLVDYGGFTVPAHSDSGPGVLMITFHAHCLPGMPVGSYSASAQLTGASGVSVVVRNTVPVSVVA